MAKRSRRERRSEPIKIPNTAPQSVSIATPTTEPKAGPVSVASPVEAASNRKTAEIAHDYFYVFQELQTIGLVAVVMFIVLVGLSYVI
jgi:hypothetical protein